MGYCNFNPLSMSGGSQQANTELKKASKLYLILKYRY